MAGSSFGQLFRITTFGESHGVAIGGVIDGVPSNINIDLDLIQRELDRRKPGQSTIVTQRKESDTVEFLSGIFEGKTTGAPIGFVIKNDDQRSNDYSHIKDSYRPSHADLTYQEKYGYRDYRGGGRSSARETACRVVGGAIAKQILNKIGIEIVAYVDQVGALKITSEDVLDFNEIEKNPVRCPHKELAIQMEELIKVVRKEGDTIGGAIKCIIKNVPIGLGEPVFDRLNAEIAKAIISINAVKGIEFGSGFSCIEMKGSEHNDIILSDKSTRTNNSGGIQGGISNGMPIEFRIAFKPVATIVQEQMSIDKEGNKVLVTGKGRHDPCVVPRAVPIVEAMSALVVLDYYLRNRATQL
ncbi:MAG: chorismate synthase [Flavobacteriia bacterium]|nr:chorismate synthase [Flavobacteriia bacterium]